MRFMKVTLFELMGRVLTHKNLSGCGIVLNRLAIIILHIVYIDNSQGVPMDTKLSKEEAWAKLSKLIKPFHRVHGFLVPGGTTQEILDKLTSFKLEPSDVWISTFPKSGTTWTQQIVRLIRNKGESDDLKITHSVPWLESKMASDVDNTTLPTPRAFKSHMPYEVMPCDVPGSTPCKYIYIARNPKDVAVSLFFHYKRNHALPNANIDWSLFLCNFHHGNTEFGDFFDHVLSWWAHRNDPNVLFLTFEDMKRDLPSAIAHIARFIEIDISDEIISKIADKTSFSLMKSDDTVNYSWEQVNTDATDFMRKGEVGDWVNHFTPEQSAEMDRECSKRLDGTGLEFIYKI